VERFSVQWLSLRSPQARERDGRDEGGDEGAKTLEE
jgi:hypothetical protein